MSRILLTELFINSSVQDFFTCVICTHIVSKPKDLSCGHLFCGSCLELWCATDMSCPTCRDKFDLKSIHVNAVITKIISQMEIKCINYIYGCEFKHIVGETNYIHQSHEAKCGYRKVKCPHCDKDILKRQQHKHNKKIKCPLCSLITSSCQADEHKNQPHITISKKQLEKNRRIIIGDRFTVLDKDGNWIPASIDSIKYQFHFDGSDKKWNKNIHERDWHKYVR